MPGIEVLAAQNYAAALLRPNAEGAAKPAGAKGPRRTVFQALFDQERGSVALADLTEIAGMEDAKALETLKDRLDAAGDRLKDRGSSEDYAAYRKAVQHFVKYVVARNYGMEHETVTRMKRNAAGVTLPVEKIYVRIKVIDEKLDRLASEVLLNHKDKLGLLARIDEINGLVVDLLS